MARPLSELVKKTGERFGFLAARKIAKLKDHELKELELSHIEGIIDNIDKFGRLTAAKRLVEYAIKKGLIQPEKPESIEIIGRLVKNLERSPTQIAINSSNLLVFIANKNPELLKPFIKRLEELEANGHMYQAEEARFVLKAMRGKKNE